MAHRSRRLVGPLVLLTVLALTTPTVVAAAPNDPTVTIDDVSLLEGDDGPTTFEFTVTATDVFVEAFDVDWETQDDTATSGSGDYVAAASTVTFEPDATASSQSETIEVTVNGDTTIEPDETFTVVLSDPGGQSQAFTIGDGDGVGTIRSDEPRVSVASAEATEGDDVVFAVTLVDADGQLTPASADLTIEYTVTGGTAAADDDYTPVDGTVPDGTPLAIPQGETQGEFRVATVQDPDPEADETITLELSAPAAFWDPEAEAVVVDSLAVTGTILDDEPRVTVHHATAVEGHGGLTDVAVAITVTDPPATDLTLDYATAPGSATANSDYAPVTDGQVTIPAGSTADRNVTVRLVTDATAEPDEEFTVAFSIAEADLPDGWRYQNVDGEVTEADGELTATSTVTIVDDDTIVITIGEGEDSDDDGVPDRLAAEGFEGDSGGTTTIEVPVRFDHAAGTVITLPYYTKEGATRETTARDGTTGSAIEDRDFEPIPISPETTATIPAGDLETVMSFTVNGDDKHELDEPLEVIVDVSDIVSGETALEFDTDGDGVSDGPQTADVAVTVRILNDDPVPTLFVDDLAVAEGLDDRFFEFDVWLSNPTYTCFEDVVLGVTDGPVGEHPATAGEDYAPTTVLLSIDKNMRVPSESTQCTGDGPAVMVHGDTEAEPNETFAFVVTTNDQQVVRLPDGEDELVAIATIVNDDGRRVVVDDIAVTEGNTGTTTAVFEVTVLDAGGEPVSVDYATEDGSALAGTDYTAAAGTLEIAAGAGSATISVPVVPNEVAQPDREFSLLLSNAVGATIATEVAVATIVDDDAGRPVADAGPDRTVAQGAPVTFDASGSSDSDGSIVSYVWDFGDGTAPVTAFTATVTHVFQEHGTFPVELTVVDDDGEAAHDTALVSVTSASPKVTVTGDATVEVAEPATFQASANDSTGQPVMLRWDLGDGSGAVRGKREVTHAYAEPGTFTVTVAGTDEQGATGRAQFEVTVAPDSGSVTRAAGDDRIATAVAVARTSWAAPASASGSATASAATGTTTPGAPHAVLATAGNYPDALAGAPLAALLDAPILLTPSDHLDPSVAAELKRGEVRTVWILGGAAAISDAVAQELLDHGYQAMRFQGVDRFGTAAAIAGGVQVNSEGEVVLALGQHADASRDAWPDALAAGALAAVPDPMPVLLTRSDALPQSTEQALHELEARRVYVIGGEAAISSTVTSQLEATGLEVVRLAGESRYGTSVAVAEEALDRHGGTASLPVVFARGTAFPDGLPAGALAARVDGLLLLVPTDDLGAATEIHKFLTSMADRLDDGVAVGGPAAISERTVQQLAVAIRAAP